MVVKIVCKLSFKCQNEVVRAILKLANDFEPEAIDTAHLPAVLEGLAQAKAGQYAPAADVEAAFRRFDT